MKTKTTKRKFYNKWLYKVSLSIEGAAAFRQYPLSDLEYYVNTDNIMYDFLPWYIVRLIGNRIQAKELIDTLSTVNDSEYVIRVEGSILDVYTNNVNLYNLMSTNLATAIRYRCEPLPSAINTLDDDNIILTKRLPQDRYSYRVYLKPHKLANDFEGKKKYLSWLKSQTPKLTCTESIENWFLKTDWNWDRRYILVEDEKTLLLLRMRNSEVCGRVYKFVLLDK